MNNDFKQAEKYAGYVILGLVLFISAIVRFQYMFTQRLWPDEALYAWSASRIFANPLMVFSAEVNEFHPPLFAALLSLGNFLGPGLTGYQLVSLFAGLLGIYIIYYVGKNIHSDFVGASSALVLAFNFVYLKFSAKILMDALFMAVFLLFLYTLGKVDKNSNERIDQQVGLWAAILIGIKWTGLLCVPIVLAYYLIIAKGNKKKLYRKIIVPLAIILGWIGALFIVNYFQMGSVMPDLATITKKTQETPAWFYFPNLVKTLDHWYLVPFVFIGIAGLFKDRRNSCISLITGWIVCLIGLSLAPERILRYSLPYLPIMIIFAMIGVSLCIQKYVHRREERPLWRLIVILFLGFIAFNRYPHLEFMLNEENKFSNEFSGAGQWVRNHAQTDALIVSSSYRQIRYFSGINFARFGGRLIELPDSGQELAKIVNTARRPVILEVDNWGKQGKLLVDPATNNGITQLEEMGFVIKYTAGKMRYQTKDEEGLIAPALWIFEKEHP